MRELLALVRSFVEPRLRGGWTGDHVDDVVQETVIRALQRARKCRARSREQWKAWVFAIARRQIAELHREAHRRRSAEREAVVDPGDPREPGGHPTPTLSGLVQAAEADACPDLQSILYGRFACGEEWGEIGSRLGVSASAAKRRFQRFAARVRNSSP